METTFHMIVFINVMAVLLTFLACFSSYVFFSYLFIGRRDGNVVTLMELTGLSVLWICLAAWNLGEIIHYKLKESAGKGNSNATSVEITTAIGLAVVSLFNSVLTVSNCIYLTLLAKKSQRVAPEPPAPLPVGQPIQPEA